MAAGAGEPTGRKVSPEEAQRVARLDQDHEHARDVASIAAVYWRELVERGVPPMPATHLTNQYVHELMQQPPDEGDTPTY